MKRPSLIALLLLLPFFAHAFCGFYVAKVESDLFNRASKVAIARDGDRTVLTMANDYHGDLKEFAVVFPVPVVPQREDIKVVPLKILEKLDAFSAPRLVEYHDPDPCPAEVFVGEGGMSDSSGISFGSFHPSMSSEYVPVKIEAKFDVEEYEILVLSSTESKGLERWLRNEGYRIPAGASKVLGSYIRQNMKFFVAKVNLEKQSKLGYTYLRPLQIRYESKKFALPIRLGTLNAKGDQELLAYMLSPKGRVECTNYKTKRLPTDVDVPLFVRDEFEDFYRDMFYYQVAKTKKRVVFMEYGWDMGWCDPCAGDPLTSAEQVTLGCDWIQPRGALAKSVTVKAGDTLYRIAKAQGVSVKDLKRDNRLSSDSIAAGQTLRVLAPGESTRVPGSTFVTRLHFVYNAETFPEDLQFQETADRESFQGRYVLNNPWTGRSDSCDEAKTYYRELRKKRMERVDSLVELTGWDLNRVRQKTGLTR